LIYRRPRPVVGCYSSRKTDYQVTVEVTARPRATRLCRIRHLGPRAVAK